MAINDWSSDVCSSDLQRLFLRRCNPVRDEPAKKTVHHPGSWQAQRAKLQASPRCGRLHVLAARPAKSQMVENLGTMPSPRSAEPVIALKLCRRCSDLLGKIRNHGIRKLAGAAPKASRRTVQEQLRGKADPRRRRLCIQNRKKIGK